MRLGQLPSIRFAPSPEGRESTGQPHAEILHPDTPLAEVDTQDAPALVVIQPNVALDAAIQATLPETALLNSDQIFGYPARLRVSGTFTPQGVCVVPQKAIPAFGKLTVNSLTPSVIVPKSLGILHGNRTPEEAFETAFFLARAPKVRLSSPPERTALAASLGMDALNGLWWILGTFSGLSPSLELGEAWDHHSSLLSAPDAIDHHFEAEARALRLETRLPVRAINSEQSLVLKAGLPDWPGPEYWAAFDKFCKAHGGAFADLATSYRAAAAYLWEDCLA